MNSETDMMVPAIAHGVACGLKYPGNVASLLLADKNAEDVALLSIGRDYTYSELRDYCFRISSFLTTNSRPGERILLSGDASFSWIGAYLGTMLAGCVAVPVPPEITKSDLQHIISITGARVGFLQDTFAAKHRDSLDGITVIDWGEEHLAETALPTLGNNDSPGAGRAPQEGSKETSGLAALMFTSGSTSRPRGVMITHRNIIANTESIVEYLGLTRSDRILAALPFHYCFGASLLHTHLSVGGSLVIDNRFRFPEAMLRRMQDTCCTGFAGVPSHYHILLRRSGLSRMNFPYLRYVQQAGGHLAPALVSELRRALPRTQVYLMYGQTEATARLSYLPPKFLDTKPGSIGRGIPGVQLSVVDVRGEPVAPGVIGEIVAEGENISSGYWCDPQETAKYFRAGKLHTGDLAVVDEEGFIYIVERAKDFVKCGGYRLSCQKIEEILLECRELVEAAVIGVHDPVLGEAIQAFVVPRDSWQTEAVIDRIRAFCGEHLPLQLRPRKIVAMAELPKNSSGKVMKAVLRAAP
jgi:acyl-CoA synthetase (AMP-forming)/AMP-acid ligase II